MKTINIKENFPTGDQAVTLLTSAIQSSQGQKIIKIIHGYGSSGVGGEIKHRVHASLRAKKKSGMIKDFVPGEAIFKLETYAEVVSKWQHLLKTDPDFKHGNDGITFVILKP